ncbi:hypothetical protein [Duganella sp.]|uniref:hypothetical protein n=1 Tax=Duganella sp. TaxID=1904440 RepID=UPI0031D304D3
MDSLKEPNHGSYANESHATSAYDDHEARLAKLEKAVADLQCDIALLRQRMDSGFEAVQVQFALTEEKLRREFNDGLHALERRMSAKIEAESQRLERAFSSQFQVLIARMDLQDARMDRHDARMDARDARMDRTEAKLDRLDAKIDHLAKWLIGAQVTTMAFVVAIAVQLFLR